MEDLAFHSFVPTFSSSHPHEPRRLPRHLTTWIPTLPPPAHHALKPMLLQGRKASLFFPAAGGTQQTRTNTVQARSSKLDRKTNDGLVADGTTPAKKMIWMRILEEGVFRFDASEGARKESHPSLSFFNPIIRETCLDDGSSLQKEPFYVPSCRCEREQQTITIEFPLGTSFYGTGEVSGPLERTGKRIFCWNTDAWGYGPSTTSLYQSHPWVLAVLPDGHAFGALADTSQRCEVDLRREAVLKFVAPAFYPVITFGPYLSVDSLLVALGHAVGTISMPPKWSLGYHQCRWSYEPASRVLEVARIFREKSLPCDVMWMDIDYMDGFRCFTFHPEKFQDPQNLARDLHDQGFKAVWMLDPGIKLDVGYSVYDSGCSQDAWILKPNGKPYVGEVWPGSSVFPDYTSAKIRRWWAELVCEFTSNGVDGIWNDMNEPTVFETVSKTIPDTTIHTGDPEIGGCRSHAYYHNVYGMLMARSTYEGMLLADSQKRPFVLTRAGYIGSHRYAATWTGDNLSTWDHLHMSIPISLNLGLSGQAFSGPDIGGFAGAATPKLFARWMGICTLFPFARGHSEKGTIDHEPWEFGSESEDVCRLAINRRYRFLPHLYTLFYKSHMTGVPVMSPLFFADSKDPRLRNVEDSFLLGPLLVSASTSARQGSDSKETAFPQGIWQRFNFDDDHPELPLLYLRAGSIIPTGGIVQHTGEINLSDAITLIVALDENGKAEGLLYEDEGDGFGYQQGEFLLTTYKAQVENRIVTIKIGHSEGHLERPRRILNIVLLVGEAAKLETTGIEGEGVTLELPSESEIDKLVIESQQRLQYRMKHMAAINHDMENLHALKDMGAHRTLIELIGGDWHLKVVPQIGGRITSMVHSPTGIEWLWSRLDMSGYEEYSGVEYRSPGCVEEYNILKEENIQTEGEKMLLMEGDISGGLSLQRQISVINNMPNVLQIKSQIIAKSVGAGGGGFSRMVCLRVHPTFQLRHPMETTVRFISVDGTMQEVNTDTRELYLQGDARPNGEWALVDKCANIALINRFNLEEVAQCLVCWGPGTCNLELWSEERPVSRGTPITICHKYETVTFQES